MLIMSALGVCHEWIVLSLLPHVGWALDTVTHTGSFGQQEEHKATRPRKWRLVSMTKFSQFWP